MRSFHLNPRWKIRREYFGGLMMDMTGQGRVTYVNPVGIDILELCSKTSCDPVFLTKVLSSLYDTHTCQLQGSVDDFLSSLTKNKVLLENNNSADMSPSNATEFLRNRHNSTPEDYLSAPFEINVYSTTRCNLDCTFCYLSKDIRTSYGPRRADEDSFFKFFDQCVEANVFGINFLGGEPFLDAGIIERAIDQYHGEFLINITTNGTQMKRISDTLLHQLAQPGVDVIVSIHSSNPQKHDKVVQRSGSWKRAMDFVEALANHGVRVVAQMVFTQENTSEEALALMDQIKQRGADGFFVNIPFAGGHMSLEEYAEIRPQNEEIGKLSKRLNSLRREFGDQFYVYLKGAYSFMYDLDFVLEEESPMDRWLTHPVDGGISLELMSDGIVQLGSLFIGSALTGAVGNIQDDSLFDIWHAPEVAKWRNRPQTELKEPCKSCEHNSYCSGGNFIQSLNLFGSASVGDVRCPLVWKHLEKENSMLN